MAGLLVMRNTLSQCHRGNGAGKNEYLLEMNAAAFLLALRRRARATSPARDPLTEARHFLDKHGETAEGQALRRVIDTLASGNGEFAESEVWLFSAETLALVAALVEARIKGVFHTEED